MFIPTQATSREDEPELLEDFEALLEALLRGDPAGLDVVNFWGEDVGFFVGAVVGVPEFFVGEKVGIVVGVSVGMFEGFVVGAGVTGDMVGFPGATDGGSVGDFVGVELGSFVGGGEAEHSSGRAKHTISPGQKPVRQAGLTLQFSAASA